jgi:signal transduction histidine kinase
MGEETATPNSAPPVPPDRGDHSPGDIDVFRLIVQTSARLRQTRDPEKVLQVYLRSFLVAWKADAACVAAAEPGRREASPVLSLPRDVAWDPSMLTALALGARSAVPLGMMSARIERRGRPWGAIVFRRESRAFSAEEHYALARVASEIEMLLGLHDDSRLADVRGRIDVKIMRDLAPKDLYYQILDGLHQLTRYDHSASLFLLDAASGQLQLVAEQVAWRKMKSSRIGELRPLGRMLRALIAQDALFGFDRWNGGWREWTDLGAVGIAEALDIPADTGDGTAEPSLGSMLCAAVGSTQGGLGLLRLGAVSTATFGPYELGVVRRMMPAVSVAIQRAQEAEEIRSKALLVERRAGLAHLARGVAHDVNNALGSVLPLVQQMRVDLEQERLGPERLAQDLAQIEGSIEAARRIFTGMLRWARSSASSTAVCEAHRAVRSACDVLESTMKRAGITLVLELAEGLPAVDGRLAELEQLFLNLATNAIEAMPQGGCLTISSRAAGRDVWIDVTDTGCGIAEDLLLVIDKPFVTTKEGGTGLGLPTCRSILTGVGGDLTIESAPEQGTRVSVRLRIAAEDSA